KLENILSFFQAEDGIRDFHVTGVQTCALPIFGPRRIIIKTKERKFHINQENLLAKSTPNKSAKPTQPPQQRAQCTRYILLDLNQIGRASCRERVKEYVDAVVSKEKVGGQDKT